MSDMAKKVTIDNLGDAIKSILTEYDNQVSQNVNEITKKMTQTGVKALKSESKSSFGTVPWRKRKYADTWTSQFITGRLSSQGTIYNTQAGLPHLLEHGHAKVNGGRVAGRAHIKPVEDMLIRQYESEVISKL